MLKQYPKKTIEIDKESDKGITFRIHNNNSHVQTVNVEKNPTKGGSSDNTKNTRSKTPKPTVKKEKDFDEEKKVLPTDKPVTPAPTPKKNNVLPDCSDKGSKLVGPLFIDQSIPKDMEAVEKDLSVDFGGTVEKGGKWAPTTCKPKHKVAIIIPYRKRFEQLKIFLRHMHPFLQRQELLYQIFVVEQLKNDPFNRAGLFNVGFVESLKMNKGFDCFIFTDVDLLPEDDHNYYGCPTSPRHMSVAVDKFNYRLPYATIFGGVGAFTKEDFQRINGFSNMFWGWGGEDDDLYTRITKVGFKLTRPSLKRGRYTMIRIHHFQSSKADPNRMNLLRNSAQRMSADGLNTLKYKLDKVDQQPLVTFVKIELKRSMYSK
ncbi:beta-1,4-galactosyltransferase 2-like [Clytia hemisphaerica]|uniref:beta-1,4-galactosyltransferase 2-like n=1 Tax=Clytia hemisphaerica TaxID=252671 RepID=UPI0034D570C7